MGAPEFVKATFYKQIRRPGVFVEDMIASLPLKDPWLWGGTLMVCVGAAWLVAQSERGDAVRRSEIDQASAPRQEQAPIPTASEPSPNGRPGRKSAPRENSSAAPGSWVSIPKKWMELTGAGLHRPEIHKVLGLNHPESEALGKMIQAVMKTAREQQAATLTDVVLSENETIRIPALGDNAIKALSDEVLASLPERAAPADHELAAFLMERQLRKEYGQTLLVTLKFQSVFSTWSVRSSPSKLLGFGLMVEPENATSDGSANGMETHAIGGGRFDFLKVDPSVNNEGRNPMKR